MEKSKETNLVTKEELKVELTTLKSELKSEIQENTKSVRGEMKQMEERIIQHFDVTAENMRNDFHGIHKNKISSVENGLANHELRLKRVEEKAGII